MKTKIPFEYIVLATIVVCLGLGFAYMQMEKRQIEAENSARQAKAMEAMSEKRMERDRKLIVDFANAGYKLDTDAAYETALNDVRSGQSAQLARIEYALKMSRASAEREAMLRQ